MWFPVALLICASCAAPSGEPEVPARPNVLLFLVDDLGWHDTALTLDERRTDGQRRFRTPSLERLAARGTTFTNAYAAAPVCTPSRTSLMTGRSPGRSHITYWTLWKDRDTSTEYPDVSAPAWNVNGLQRDDVTLPNLLAQVGYRTIHVGKAHFGAVGTTGADPLNLGFHVNVAGHGPGAPGSFLGTQDFSVKGRTGKGGPAVWDVPGLHDYHGKDVYLTEALTSEAKKHVRAAVESGQPFFLHFAPYAVHTPIQANSKRLEPYEDLDPREAAYATMVETVDHALGELLVLLDELDITENTIVVFTSDNGGLSAHARGGEPHVHNTPLRSGKGSAYEGGTRVPQVIAWPGVTDGGGRTDTQVILYDLFPTVLDWAGVDMPAEHRPTVDGRDLVPLLRGEALPQRALVWHQPHFWGVSGPGIWPFTALRVGDWKLIFRHADRGFELYDLEHDLGETNDLATAEPERVRALAEQMSLWFETVDAQPSLDDTTGEPLGLPREFAP